MSYNFQSRKQILTLRGVYKIEIQQVQNSIWCIKPVIFQMWKVLKICSNKKNITIKPLKWNNLNTNLRHAKHFSPQRWIQSCGTEPGKKLFSKKTFLSYSFIQALKICFVFNLQLTKKGHRRCKGSWAIIPGFSCLSYFVNASTNGTAISDIIFTNNDNAMSIHTHVSHASK